MQADWLLWQLADSAFPTGGFGHSSGLEAAWQHRELRTKDDLISFLRTALCQLQHGALPFVKAAHQRENAFQELDWLCDAFVSNHVANRASRAQGNALSASAERSFEREALRSLRKLIRDEGLSGHLPPVFGAVTLCLNLQLGEAIRLFVFTQMRGMVNAAVRLGIVGPLEAQAIQHRLGPLAEQTATQARQLGLNDLAQTAPLLDLLQGTQDRLYSRLFQS